MEKNIFLFGDSIEQLKLIESNSIDLSISSPPYYAYKPYKTDNNLDLIGSYKLYINYMDKWIKENYRVLNNDSRLCIVIDDKHTNLKTDGINKNLGTHAKFIEIAEKYGFIYKDLIIWSKIRSGGNASGGSNYLLGSYPYPPNIPLINMFEYILIFQKKEKNSRSKVIYKTKEEKEKSKLTFEEFKWASTSIWEIFNKKNNMHIATFPEEIPYRLIKLFSFVNDIILDVFCGIGTTGKVAKKLNRYYIGIDSSEEYINYAKEFINLEFKKFM